MTKLKTFGRKIDRNTNDVFIYILALISIVGFIILFLNSWDIINLSSWNASILLMIFGVGLLFEGKIIRLIKGFISKKKRFEPIALAHMFTNLIGLIVIITGILIIPVFGFTMEGRLGTFVGLTAIFAIFTVLYETFLLK